MDTDEGIKTNQEGDREISVPAGTGQWQKQRAEQRRERCLAEFHNFCGANNIDPFVVAGKRRTWDIVSQRDKVVEHLHRKGFPALAIAYVLRKDHSSVLHSLGKSKNEN